MVRVTSQKSKQAMASASQPWNGRPKDPARAEIAEEGLLKVCRLPLVSTCAMPRPEMNRISVAMIGCTRSTATMTPLNSPQAIATTSGTAIAAAIPKAGFACPKSDWKISGARAPASAITAPTDRSMPPVAITSVMPIATIAMVAT